MRRITILLATVGALLLVPATQAFAEGTLTVNTEGSGTGEVSSVGGIYSVPFSKFTGIGESSPPIECTYKSPGPATGVCETPLEEEEGESYIAVHVVPAAGSEFAEFVIEEGEGFAFEGQCESANMATPRTCLLVNETPPGNVAITVKFTKEGGGGPTNKRTLTLTKSPAPNAGTGQGSITSKPKGVKCGYSCDEAVASMYKDTPVVLKEKPSTTSTFVEWTGACSGSAETCTVPMAEDEAVGAVFTGTTKAFSPAEALTVDKAGSGSGTVKGTGGLGCEAECSETTVLYQGPITEPKPKPGKTVTLKQAPAFGSEFSGWSGCDSEVEGNCLVTMETDRTVTAEYTALPNKVLTVNKDYSVSGNGSVTSKPKGIKCGAACDQAVASMPEGAAIELKAKPSTGVSFVEWAGGDCNGSTNVVCVVTMDADETTEAVFSAPSKALTSEATLTLSKAGSGFGTVKATGGLGCEALCTSTDVVYQGPVTEPKPKAGKTVTLSAVPAPGSGPVVWTGCDSEPEGTCVVAMEASREVTASFSELE